MLLYDCSCRKMSLAQRDTVFTALNQTASSGNGGIYAGLSRVRNLEEKGWDQAGVSTAKTSLSVSRGDVPSGTRLHCHFNASPALEWVSQNSTRCVSLAGTNRLLVTMTSTLMFA